MKKNDLQSYLRDAGLKVCEIREKWRRWHLRILMQTNPPNTNLDNDNASNQEIPEIGELASGWSSDPYLRPTLSHKDNEHYLLNSSHMIWGQRENALLPPIRSWL